MLFQSFEFLIFLTVVFFSYWIVLKNSFKAQNVLLLFASYVFYGWWDWRFLSLIGFSSLLDYIVANKVYFYLTAGNKRKAKLFLWISLGTNLCLLGFFKYYNFFIESAQTLLNVVGFQVNDYSLTIILPVGISFYTFQTLSYSIDIYRGKLKPTKDPIAFFAFVSFFPQLVAGPIERASNLLPQLLRKRLFSSEQGKDGLRQFLWGLFKKIVVADTCAIYVNDIFLNYEDYSGSTLVLGAVFFAFQIYGDFSGYSDMAIGLAKLFGIQLMTNFRFPYFSRDVSEFWRRWHVSLSTWFRDYVYIPLGGNRGTKGKIIINTFIIFVVSGFWHGANWTFVIWGVLHAVYFLPLLILNKNKKNIGGIAENRFTPSLLEFLQIVKTFTLITLGWIFFRSDNVTSAFQYINGMVSKSIFSVPEILPLRPLAILVLFIFIEWIQRNKIHVLSFNKDIPTFFRWTIYVILVFSILFFEAPNQSFIYFQF